GMWWWRGPGAEGRVQSFVNYLKSKGLWSAKATRAWTLRWERPYGPRYLDEDRRLVLELAREHPSWGRATLAREASDRAGRSITEKQVRAIVSTAKKGEIPDRQPKAPRLAPEHEEIVLDLIAKHPSWGRATLAREA